ncbi:hypothetical protein RhiirA5_440766 [Rhizophagus irregularis]|uniref:Uncharacterized protein n=1 Tax=Rhizophagus irregularis TaxID=588596 RepID=A0A2N0NGF9_9GLOM|nr:hypothetical protein RhiirA5_440766 [Rhizophagus irregularis]
MQISKKELEEEEYRKSQGEKKWEKKHSIQKAKGILLDGIRTLPYGHWQIGLYKCLMASEIAPEEAEERVMKKQYKMVNHKDIELAQVKVIKTALRKGKKYDNFAKNYEEYLKKL